MRELPQGKDVNYWKTGRSSPDSWIAKARREIEGAGGTVTQEAFGCEPEAGRSAFLLRFTLDGECFRLVWPVLPCDPKDEAAARRQAATMLYRDVKARCLSALVLGAHRAFFAYMQLKDGRTVSDLMLSEIDTAIPPMLAKGRART